MAITNLFEVLQNPEYHNFDCIKRFNKYPVFSNESDSQHSWWVAFYVKCLLDETMIEHGILEDYKLRSAIVEGALLHDFPELWTSDVLHDVKYNKFNGGKIKDALEDFEEHCLSNLMGKGGCFDALGNTIHTLAKTKLIKAYVKLGDWFAIIKHLMQEIRLGNRNLKAVFDKCLTAACAAIAYLNSCIELHNNAAGRVVFNRRPLLDVALEIENLELKHIKNGPVKVTTHGRARTVKP